MEFKLKPFSKNLFPKSAVLVCHTSPRFWLQEIQQMGINLNEVSIYPVPSSTANVLYGCLIVFKDIPKKMDIGRNIFFQNIHDKLFIPENAIISPMVSLTEMHQFFSEYYHIFHSDFGLVELTHEVNWTEIVSDCKEVEVNVRVPSKSVSIPRSITSLRIEVDEEEILKQLETPEAEEEFLENLPFDLKKVLNGNQREMDKFLKYLEKHPEMALQLGIPLDVMNTNRGGVSGKFRFNNNGSSWFDFSAIFGKSNGNSSGSSIFRNFDSSIFQNSKYIFLKTILVIFFLSKLITTGSIFIALKWIFVFSIIIGIIIFIIRITADKEEVNNIRHSNNYNQSETTRSNEKYFPIVIIGVLLTMSFLFVRYLISDNSNKSISPIFHLIWVFIIVLIVLFILIKIFNNISINSNNSSSRSNSGNAALLDSNRFYSLHKKYEDLAQEYISKKEYEKAAHVYLKLLQNKVRAAQVLEEGKMYQEAALVYLKHCQDKSKAAECYENGKAYKEAIALYKEFNMSEKVGDLYVLMHQKKTANEYYYKVVDDYKNNFQFIKASLILKNKIGDNSYAQNLLFEGWTTNKDGANCLSYYFYNIDDSEQLKYEINSIYKDQTSDEQLESLLTVIKKEYERSDDLKDFTKEIGYEIIAKRIQQNPNIASELISFNKTDSNITKDVMKYKFNKKKTK